MSKKNRYDTILGGSAPLNRFGILLLTVLFLAGCVVAAPPSPLPPVTLSRAALPGSILNPSQSISSLAEGITCLAADQPVYGQISRDSNVRTDPAADSCVVATIRAGTQVHITQFVNVTGESEPTHLGRSLKETGVLTPTMAALGYTEDVQPIFQTACTTCHGETLQSGGLKVIEYETLMAGSQNGPVVIPGDPVGSRLWHQISTGVMPLVGELTPLQKSTIGAWIGAGAAPTRTTALPSADIWFEIDLAEGYSTENSCAGETPAESGLINSGLVRLLSCGLTPTETQLATAAPSVADPNQAAEATVAENDGPAASTTPNTPDTPTQPEPARPRYAPGQTGITATALGLGAPGEGDQWMVPKGGFCIEQRLPQLQDQRGITAMTFAPDGRLFLALDEMSSGSPDPLIFFDAYHPSRTLLGYDTLSDSGTYELMTESSRIVGMDYDNGALYLNRAGEVGRIVDGGGYERLAAGFAVNGRLFHANDGLAVLNGWLYVSAGAMRDGYSDGIIAPGPSNGRSAESLALEIAGKGNAYAGRLVRAQVSRLVTERSIGVFQTAARGFRNPYGLGVDPFGRLWVTDNGATNFPGERGAGDEVNLFDPGVLSAAAAAGDEEATPYYGFPIVLSGQSPDWYTPPVLDLFNAAAPTSITWAFNTIFYAQYGRDPGLYRLARTGDGRIVSERILFTWPLVAMTTAPDGAIWIGTGFGGVYRLTPGC